MNTALILAFAELAASRAGCKDYRDQLWIKLQDIGASASVSKNVGTAGLESEIEARLRYYHPSIAASDRNRVASSAARLLRTVSIEVPRAVGVREKDDVLEVLTAAEYGDAVSPLRSFTRDRVETGFRALEAATRDARIACAGPEAETPMVAFADTPAAELAHIGARRSFATIYQSCGALDVDPLTNASPDIRGITIRGKHSDGIGSKRYITDVKALVASHPYIRPPESGCRDVRSSPPIYDYGGRPQVADAASTTLDFFRDGGSGTSVLGVDCSAYVWTALAAKGLKLKSSVPLKASGVLTYSSRSYMNPASNGMDCMERVKFSKGVSLEKGDIIVVVGHIVMVDKVGGDPFGLNKISRLEDCGKAGNAKDYDFTIFQSSPSAGGIGVNRYVASEYMPTSAKFKDGLKQHAIQACRARFGATATVPSSASAYVIRHKGTTACRAPAIQFVGGDCANSCAR